MWGVETIFSRLFPNLSALSEAREMVRMHPAVEWQIGRIGFADRAGRASPLSRQSGVFAECHPLRGALDDCPHQFADGDCFPAVLVAEFHRPQLKPKGA